MHKATELHITRLITFKVSNSILFVYLAVLTTTTLDSVSLILFYSFLFFSKDFIYSFWDRGGGREKERERNTDVWLPLTCPQLETWPETQACALTRNWAGNSLVCRPGHNPLSHTSQGVLFNTLYRYVWCLPLNVNIL